MAHKLQCNIAVVFNLKIFYSLLYVGIHVGILHHFSVEFIYKYIYICIHLLLDIYDALCILAFV